MCGPAGTAERRRGRESYLGNVKIQASKVLNTALNERRQASTGQLGGDPVTNSGKSDL
jgi:hypothetical protein